MKDLVAAEDSEAEEASAARARCTRQCAQIASRNAKFRSSRRKADRSIAVTASRSIARLAKAVF